MRVGIATIAAGRRAHLRRQARAVTASAGGVARYVVVAMDDRPVPAPGAEVLRVEPGKRGLPLAAARNRAVAALGDCDLAILLDVDCIPDRELVHRYVAAHCRLGEEPGLLCGPVGYLRAALASDRDPSPGELADARGRVIRDFPSTGMRRQPRPELFWSLSFAVAPETHRRIGGFDEAYVGYGAEDTDYGLRSAAAGIGLWFVAGAWAYHQPHPPSPPRRLAEVVANARRFHGHWGFWPMPGVLAEAADRGRIRWTPAGTVCELV